MPVCAKDHWDADTDASMVNNAGISPEARALAPVHEMQEDTWDLTMRVNAKSVYLGCKFALRQMLAQEPHESGDRGWIVNTSSIMALIAGYGCRRPPVCHDFDGLC